MEHAPRLYWAWLGLRARAGRLLSGPPPPPPPDPEALAAAEAWMAQQAAQARAAEMTDVDWFGHEMADALPQGRDTDPNARAQVLQEIRDLALWYRPWMVKCLTVSFARAFTPEDLAQLDPERPEAAPQALGDRAHEAEVEAHDAWWERFHAAFTMRMPHILGAAAQGLPPHEGEEPWRDPALRPPRD